MSNPTYDRLIKLLDDHKATYRLMDHEPEGRTEIISPIRGNELCQAAKCMVVMVKLGKKDKKFILAVVPGDAKVDLEGIKSLYSGTYASFADEAIAEELSGSVVGTVLPFTFDDRLEMLVDPRLLDNEELFFNAARLDQSMALKTSDYVKITSPRLEPVAIYKGQESVLASRKDEDVDDLYKMRHSLAHVLAQAVLKLYPETKLSIGPPVDNGCYYDFLFSEPITDEDFKKLEKEMRSIINKGQTFEVNELSCKDAISFWKKKKQPFKVELIEDLEKAGEKTVTNYANLDSDGNEMFVDLCKGGHVENLKDIPADGFKIMSLAGAYFRGDEKREQLTRIYVAAFSSKDELKEYLCILEEAKKRDHRLLGQKLDLFTFSDLVGPGLPLWTARGSLVRNLLDDFVWELRSAKGYERVTIPHMTKKELYETSGHWQKFSDQLFHVHSREGHEFVLKPMNCPHHTQIYAGKPRSYRDLPQRYAETTTCYRDEQTGELHGLSRVRAFTQDDAHVFCRMQHVQEEFLRIWDIVDTFYKTVGFGELQVRLSLHDPEEFEKYLGTPEAWESAESQIRAIATDRCKDFVEQTGEAAFYGPKVDFVTKDSIGREWQVATIQLDINMPEQFDLTCIDENGDKERIVMIHAAIMGSLERFFSIYLEHINGYFPLWLAPTQIAVLPVADAHESYADTVAEELKKSGIRVEKMDSSDSLPKRIRDGEKLKIPYLLVLGDKEVEGKSVAVRDVQSKEQVEVGLAEFVERVVEEVVGRG